MLRHLAFACVGSLNLLSLVGPKRPMPPPPAVVPTAKRVVTTPKPAAPPPAPTQTAPAPLPPPPAVPAPAPNSVEQARQGVAVIERQGKPVALAAVLEGDGRMLTALSALGDGNFLTARFADGTRASPLRVVHSDRGWDLALLSASLKPGQAERKAGMRASRTPSFVGLQSFVQAGSSLALSPAALQLSPGRLGGDGKALVSAYDLGMKPGLFGAPIVNGDGEVVAIIARSCAAASQAPCAPTAYGVPVSALKQFLQRAPADAMWLGLESATDDSGAVHGLRVIAVSPNGPAAIAGIRPGKDATQADLIVAVDGVPVATGADLQSALRARATSDGVEVLLFGLGRYRHVTLRPRPEPPRQ